MKIKANAKINLTLDIVGKRQDGYHLIDSVMQSVSLCDIVDVKKGDNISVKCGDSNIDGKSNIAYKAAEKFFEFTDISSGAEITIEKNIPLSSGMGGGSADAAAVIVALDKIYNTNLSSDKLYKIALSVGADVPFCINGGTARVRGIGENVEQLPNMCDCGIVLIKEGEKLSTADMYRKIDAKPYMSPCTDKMIKGIENGDLKLIAENLSNTFLSVCDISVIKNDMLTTNQLAVSLSGSGPTVFAIYPNFETAQTAAEKLSDLGYNPIVVQQTNNGLSFE